MTSRENYIRVLRKAYGETQQEFAARLEVGYSTLQGYEGGRQVPKDVRSKLTALALERNLAELALQIMRDGADPNPDHSTVPSDDEERQRALLVVNGIFDVGDPATLEALKATLRLCELHITGRPTRTTKAGQKG